MEFLRGQLRGTSSPCPPLSPPSPQFSSSHSWGSPELQERVEYVDYRILYEKEKKEKEVKTVH